MLPDFDLDRPESTAEALALLATHATGNGACRVLAGGTNLVVDLRARRASVARLVSLDRLADLRYVRVDDATVRIGARATLNDVLAEPALADAAPGLVESARWFGGHMVRNAATVAGNVCYGSPAADAVPPLLALDAEVVLASRDGERVVPLAEYYLGFKQDVRRADELLTEIRFPRPGADTRGAFRKLGLRRGDAITVAGAAVSLSVSGGRCTRARIALGALAPVVLRAREAEALLEGEAPSDEAIDAAAARAAGETSPIDDVRASAAYRREVARALTRRLLSEVRAELV